MKALQPLLLSAAESSPSEPRSRARRFAKASLLGTDGMHECTADQQTLAQLARVAGDLV